MKIQFKIAMITAAVFFLGFPVLLPGRGVSFEALTWAQTVNFNFDCPSEGDQSITVTEYADDGTPVSDVHNYCCKPKCGDGIVSVGNYCGETFTEECDEGPGSSDTCVDCKKTCKAIGYVDAAGCAGGCMIEVAQTHLDDTPFVCYQCEGFETVTESCCGGVLPGAGAAVTSSPSGASCAGGCFEPTPCPSITCGDKLEGPGAAAVIASTLKTDDCCTASEPPSCPTVPGKCFAISSPVCNASGAPAGGATISGGVVSVPSSSCVEVNCSDGLPVAS